jgi:hypothetical protein
MKLSNLNEWLTLAANFTVFAGIVFLAVEVQQNTSAVQSATILSITEASRDGLSDYAIDTGLASLRLKGDADPESLNEVEVFQYLAHNRGFWLNFQNVYLQYQLGVLAEEVWGTYSRIICTDISRHGLRATWGDHSAILDPEFVAVVESCPDF